MNRTDKLSPHFTLAELIRSDTADRNGVDNMPPSDIINKLAFISNTILEPVRSHFGKPFRPNSGYRSPELNKRVGGSPTSQHCLGEAVDIEVAGISNYDLASWVSENLDYDQLILECYRAGEPNSGWVHVSLKQLQADNRHVQLTYTNKKYLSGLVG